MVMNEKETKNEEKEVISDENEIKNEEETDGTEEKTVKNAKDEFFRKIREEEVYPLIIPINFEGKEIEELPLKGMTDIRGRHYMDATNLLRAEGKTEEAMNYDSPDFAIAMLRVVTGIAIELIYDLHSVDYRVLIQVAQGFLSRVG